MKSGVNKVIASSEDASKAAKVELSDGQVIETDVVIMGVGVGPATGFLKDSGFTLERDGGVKVDEFLRVPNLQNVYAIGKSSNHTVRLLLSFDACLRRYCGLPSSRGVYPP
jgi:NAD(P)H-nitrite reductase large subunit